MKNKWALLAAAALLAGCSENELTIENMASEPIYFAFLGAIDEVASGKTLTKTGMPNGTYAYSTTFSVPPKAKTVTKGTGLAGELTFSRSGTTYFILYSSFLLDSAYQVDANVTTSDPKPIPTSD